MSDTESLEPIGDAKGDEVPLPIAADEIRAEIDHARAATDRFRSKASELIKELRDREIQARNDAIVAQGAARGGEGARLSWRSITPRRSRRA